jgi:hypothetical protein
MVTVLLSHEVKNYPEWKKVYDAGENLRKKAGIHMSAVYQSVDNPNMVTLLGEAPDTEAVAKFMSDPQLKKDMEHAGVIGKPMSSMLKKMKL